MMNKMFDYLNRYYLRNETRSTLGQTALEEINKQFYEAVKAGLKPAILEEISKDRRREIVDRDTIKALIRIYVVMGLVKPSPAYDRPSGKWSWIGEKNLAKYESEFEAHLLKTTKEEYEKIAVNWLA